MIGQDTRVTLIETVKQTIGCIKFTILQAQHMLGHAANQAGKRAKKEIKSMSVEYGNPCLIRETE